jgi:hypothetical protein
MNSANGEVECKDLIQAHKELVPPQKLPVIEDGELIRRCMAGFGFKV